MVTPNSRSRLHETRVMCCTLCDGQGSVCYEVIFHTEDKARLAEGEDPHAASDGVEFLPFK